ncbi:MAG: HAD family hydrolase [Candidatus Kapaibacterium sp.]
MASPVKVVFFDVDDTLYDHSHHIHSGISALRDEYPFLQNYSLEYLKDISHALLEEAHLRLLKGEISLGEARRIRWKKFLEKFDQLQNYDPHVFSSLYVQAYYESERVIAGTVELLAVLKKEYSLGIISNNLLAEQLGKLKRLGISDYFDFFAISEEVGAAKPDRKIFDVALERAKVTADEAVYIADSWEIDIVGALNAGIRPIWLNRKGAASKDSSVAEISSFEPIENVLLHIRNESATPHMTRADPASA